MWHQAGRYEILTDFPLHLDIELSGICNLKCEFCFQNGLIETPLGLMDFELFKKIIDEGRAKGLCAIKLQVRGESFLHPRLFDCIKYAKDAGILDVQITTNGTLLNEERLQMILDSGLDGIIFSFDNHHSMSYGNHYKKHVYSDVEEGIRAFLALRKSRGKKSPWVRVQASVQPATDDELARLKLEVRGKYPEADAIDINRIHDFREDRSPYPDLHTHYTMLPCNYLMQRLTIFWNGDVTTCCVDYNNCFQLGNVQKSAISEIWLSKQMNNLRQMHINGQRKKIRRCKSCVVGILPLASGKTNNIAECYSPIEIQTLCEMERR